MRLITILLLLYHIYPTSLINLVSKYHNDISQLLETDQVIPLTAGADKKPQVQQKLDNRNSRSPVDTPPTPILDRISDTNTSDEAYDLVKNYRKNWGYDDILERGDRRLAIGLWNMKFICKNHELNESYQMKIHEILIDLSNSMYYENEQKVFVFGENRGLVIGQTIRTIQFPHGINITVRYSGCHRLFYFRNILSINLHTNYIPFYYKSIIAPLETINLYNHR